jgi:C2 domain
MANLVGMLYITIVEGQNLDDHELIGKQDPYVKLKLDTMTNFKKSETHERGGINPFWDETIDFQLRGNEQYVEMQVYDLDVTYDDFIGGAYIAIADLIKYRGTDHWYTIWSGMKRSSKSAGSIKLKVAFEGKDGAGRHYRKNDSVAEQKHAPKKAHAAGPGQAAGNPAVPPLMHHRPVSNHNLYAAGQPGVVFVQPAQPQYVAAAPAPAPPAVYMPPQHRVVYAAPAIQAVRTPRGHVYAAAPAPQPHYVAAAAPPQHYQPQPQHHQQHQHHQQQHQHHQRKYHQDTTTEYDVFGS